MTIWKRLRKKAEILLTRAGLAIVPRLSRKSILRLARRLGRLAYRLAPGLRALGEANLEMALGSELTPRERDEVLRKSFETFSLVMLDIFWFSKNTPERIRQWVHFDPSCEQFLRERACVCITGHLGNWEILGQAASLDREPVQSVAAPLANPALDPYLQRIRETVGQVVVPREGAAKAMLRTLRAGGRVAVVLDQNTRPSEGGQFVTFFGRAATVATAPASLALRTGSDIAFGFCLPQPDGTYVAHAPEIRVMPRTKSDASAVLDLTQAITSVIEDEIREAPWAWLWTYRRWKYCPSDDDLGRYPFYARKVSTPSQPDAGSGGEGRNSGHGDIRRS